MSTTDATVVLSLIDHITRPLAAIQARIDRLTAPIRRIGSALGDLGRVAGLERLSGSIRNIGARVQGAVGHVQSLVLGFSALSGFSLAGIGYGLKSIWDTGAKFESRSSPCSGCRDRRDAGRGSARGLARPRKMRP